MLRTVDVPATPAAARRWRRSSSSASPPPTSARTPHCRRRCSRALTNNSWLSSPACRPCLHSSSQGGPPRRRVRTAGCLSGGDIRRARDASGVTTQAGYAITAEPWLPARRRIRCFLPISPKTPGSALTVPGRGRGSRTGCWSARSHRSFRVTRQSHSRGRGSARRRQHHAEHPAALRDRDQQWDHDHRAGRNVVAGAPRHASAGAHGRNRSLDRGERPRPPRRAVERANRGRTPRARAQRHARPDRASLRRARRDRAETASLRLGRLARAAHTAHVDARLRGAAATQSRT